MPRRRRSRVLTKSEQMARVRSKNTGLEVQLRRALWASGLRYRVHADLPGTPDVAFPSARVAVFIDGCFWHGCPEHYTPPARNAEFWRRKLERNLERDRRADAELAAFGWAVLRVWEHELHEDIDRVVAKIRAAIGARGRDDRVRGRQP